MSGVDPIVLLGASVFGFRLFAVLLYCLVLMRLVLYFGFVFVFAFIALFMNLIIAL